jgi:hypothetical protein
MLPNPAPEKNQLFVFLVLLNLLIPFSKNHFVTINKMMLEYFICNAALILPHG